MIKHADYRISTYQCDRCPSMQQFDSRGDPLLAAPARTEWGEARLLCKMASSTHTLCPACVADLRDWLVPVPVAKKKEMGWNG